MASTIKVPLSKLQEASNSLSAFADDYGDVFDTLSNILEAMKSSKEWSGKSIDAAISTISKNGKKFDDFISDFENLSKFLKSYTEKMAEADADYAAQINNA